MFLGMPGDRASVLQKGALDIRVDLAETSSVFRDTSAGTDVSMSFETLRTGLFFRYGLTERLEVGLEIPALYRSRGFLEGAITATERATTGLAPANRVMTFYGWGISKLSNPDLSKSFGQKTQGREGAKF